MKPNKFLAIGIILCLLTFSCAKTQKVENTDVEELKKRQAELEASQGRVLQEIDKLKSEILVLEEAVNSSKGPGQIKGGGKIEPSPSQKQSQPALTIEAKPLVSEPIKYGIEDLKKAENLINSNQAAEAIFVLLDVESKIKTDKDRCQQGYLMARAYRELTEWEQALKWAETIDKNECHDIIPKAKFIEIESLVKLNRKAEAKKALNLLVTEYPDSEEAKKAQSLF